MALTAVLVAGCLKLYNAGAFSVKPNMAAFLIYLETGRDVRFFPSLEGNSPYFVESSAASVPEPAKPQPLPQYEKVPEIWNQSGVDVDLQGLLLEKLQWQLVTAEPTVFVFHTHTTESYTGKSLPGGHWILRSI